MTDLPKSRGNWEEDFISSLLSDESYSYYRREGVQVELLSDNLAQAIYVFVQRYYEKSRKIPILEVLEEEFPKFNFVLPRAEPHFILEKLREKWKLRTAGEALVEMATILDKDEPEEMFTFMREKVFEKETITGSNTHIIGSDDVGYMFDLYLDQISSGGFEGITTGWDPVDQITGGFRAGQIVPLLARPKRLKTWFLLKAWIEQRKQGKNPILFTLELDEHMIFRRISAMLSGVSFNDIEKGLIVTEIDQIRESWEDFKSYGPFYIARPPVGQRTVAQLLVEADKYDCESVIIDQLSFIEPRRSEREYKREDLKWVEIIYDLKNGATRQGIERPIFFAAQFNRQQSAKDDLEAGRAALSGAIEQASDSIFGLQRTEEMFEMNQVQFEIMEGRNHDTGKFFVDFELVKNTRFDMAERGHFPVNLTPDNSLLG